MRAMTGMALLVAAMALAACATRIDYAAQQTRHVQVFENVSASLPAALQRQDVQGIDSLIAHYVGPGIRLGFDYGIHGARIQPGDTEPFEFTIASGERFQQAGVPNGQTGLRHGIRIVQAVPAPHMRQRPDGSQHWDERSYMSVSIACRIHADCVVVADALRRTLRIDGQPRGIPAGPGK